jgi:hypothetical protein
MRIRYLRARIWNRRVRDDRLWFFAGGKNIKAASAKIDEYNALLW